MTWRIRVVHRSGYAYTAPAVASYNEVRMTPSTDLHQTTVASEIKVIPKPAAILRYWDYWGTQVTAFDLHEPHERLEIVSTCVVETEPAALPPSPVTWPQLSDEKVRDRCNEFLAPTGYAPVSPDLGERAHELVSGLDPVAAVESISGWTHGTLQYEPGVTAVHTSAIEALASGRGVCQDYAHLALVLLRAAGIPSRYVSGYLHPRLEAARGETVVGESHAWIEAYLGAWWGFDPTNCVPIGEQHVAVARGRDYADVPPVRGIFSGGASSSLGVDVAVTRLQ